MLGAVEVKVIVCGPLPTENDWLVCGAGAYSPLPAWLASIVHVPAALKLTVAPDTVQTLGVAEEKVTAEARRGREEVNEKRLLDAALADQERKDLLEVINRASNDHPHLRVGELLFVALTRRIKVSLDHGVDNDSRVGHSLFYIFDSELKKAVEGIPKAEEYEVR